jgi:hypothetical protein
MQYSPHAAFGSVRAAQHEWTRKEIEGWRGVVDDIQQHWCAETHQAAFPKLHMLRHTVEFAARHGFLGRASEAQIESAHASFNTLFHDHHLNVAGNTAERLRRCLADTTLRAVQPVLLRPLPRIVAPQPVAV